MSGLIDCIDQIAEQIRDGIGTEVFGIQVEAGYIINATPPCVDIYVGDPARDAQSAAFIGEGPMDGAYVFTVRTRAGTAESTEAQRLLMQFMDDESDLCVAATITEDETLNGHASSLHIPESGVSGLRQYQSGEGDALGFQFTVLVLAAKS